MKQEIISGFILFKNSTGSMLQELLFFSCREIRYKQTLSENAEKFCINHGMRFCVSFILLGYRGLIISQQAAVLSICLHTSCRLKD